MRLYRTCVVRTCSDEVYPGMFLFFCFLFLVTGCTRTR